MKESLIEIDKRNIEDFEQFYNQYKESIEQIDKLAIPIKYKKSGYIPHILLFGEMGNGKSTTGNYLIRDMLQHVKQKKPKKDQQFEASKSTKAVTNTVKAMVFDSVVYIDTPGFNDPT